MKHLELHILQSVPVACLNRDDLNSPKTAVFGGVQRARVSSQSWKRAIRELAKEAAPNLFKGNRTRRMVFALKNCLIEKGIDAECSVAIAEQVADIVETLDSKKDEDGFHKIKTLLFFSDAEYDAIANTIVNSEDVSAALTELSDALKQEGKDAEKGKSEALKKMEKTLNKGAIAKAIKGAQLKDAGDIALFGRMVANDHSLQVDGASMFTHALSTHKAANEIDFFAAVDDLQSASESGAGMTSTLEFNSATYYRFAALNLGVLADNGYLGSMTKEERREVVRTFLESTIKAIPQARKNTMNGNTMPVYVLGVVRENGHPLQLVNAFESPVRSSNGYTLESINRMNAEYADLKDTWGVEAVFNKAIVKNSLKEEVKENLGEIETCKFSELLDGMVEYVE